MPTLTGIGKFVVAIVVVSLLLVSLSTFSPYGTSNNQENLSTVSNQTYNGFIQNIYNPLGSTVSASVNTSDNLASSSEANGFAYAFVLTNMGQIYTQMTQLIPTENTELTTVFQNLNLPGMNTGYIITLIGIIESTFLIALMIYIWTKVSIW